MCGIIAVMKLKGHKASKTVRKKYDGQKHRGKEGFGFIEINNGKAETPQRAQFEKQMIEQLSKSNSTAILFHHRYPTSTPNVLGATHPIKVSHSSLKYDYYVTHNGVISNPDELKKKYEELGFVYNTVVTTKYEDNQYWYEVKKQFNDSESFAIDIARSIEGNNLITESKGSIAFIALQVEKETNNVLNVFYGRNDRNPLKMEVNSDQITIASEGNGITVPEHVLYKIDFKTKAIEKVRDLTIGQHFTASTYNGSYYYPKQNNLGFKTTKDEKDKVFDYDYSDIDDWYETNRKALPSGKFYVLIDEYTTREYDDTTSMQDDYINIIEERALLENDLIIAQTDNDVVEIQELEMEIDSLKQEEIAYEKAFEKYEYEPTL